MNLYRITFRLYYETYYVVANDVRNALNHAEVALILSRGDYAERTDMTRVDIETLCDVDHLIQDAPDKKNNPTNPQDSPFLSRGDQ